MIEDTVLRALEDSGKIPPSPAQGSGIGADYKLVMDLRRFEADYAGAAIPSATIEVNAKLLHAGDQRVVASRTFLQVQPASGTEWPGWPRLRPGAGRDRPRRCRRLGAAR